MPRNQEIKRLTGKRTAHYSIDYLVFLPGSYGASKTKRWPLILFLHGAGERGANLQKVAAHGPPNIVKTKPDFPFVLISPQCSAGQTWSEHSLIPLLDFVMQQYRVDPRRVYLTGLSMGGFGSWMLGLKYPNRFAAIAPICGGGDTLSVLLAPPMNSHRLRKLPVWAFHGAQDPIVSIEESQRMVAALQHHGNASAKLTIYPELGHDCWTEAYNDPALYEWLLRQSLPSRTIVTSTRRRTSGR